MATTSQRKRIEGWAVNVADCCGPTVRTYANPSIPRQILYPSPPPSILADLPDASPPGYSVRSSHRNKGSKPGREPFTVTEREVNRSPEKPVTVTRRYKTTREASPPRRSAPTVARTAVRSSRGSDDGKYDRRSQYSRSDARTERRTSRDEQVYREREAARYREDDCDRRTTKRHDSPLELVDVTRIPSRRSGSRSPKQSVLRRVFRLPERESRKHYYEEDARRGSRRRSSVDRQSRTRSVDGHSLAYGAGRDRRDTRATKSVYDPSVRHSVYDSPDRVYYIDDRDRRHRDTFVVDDRPKRSSSMRNRTKDYDDDFMGRWGEGFGKWAWGKDKTRDWDARDRDSGRRLGRLPRPAPPPSASAWEAKRLSGRDFDGYYARDSRRY